MNTKEKRPAAKPAQRRSSAKGRAQQKARRTRRSASQARKPAVQAQRPAQAVQQRPAAQPVKRPSAPKTAQRQAQSARSRSMKRAESQVVYTPPKTFSKFKLLLGIVSVVAIVLALTLGMSIFFKVEHINISGTQKYSAWDIQEASGIQVGENLMTLGKARVSGKIITQLPYVEQVRIGIKLPDTVNIEIIESEVIYTIQAEDETWWIINSQGRVLEPTTAFIAEHFTMIQGVYIAVPTIGEPAKAASAAPQETEETLSEEMQNDEETLEPTSPVDLSNGPAQLAAALAIVQTLEKNGIVGDANSVNVADLYNLELTYDKRYQVLLGESTQLDYKIRAMQQAALQMTDYQQGTLDVSFTIWPDKVGYTPFVE